MGKLNDWDGNKPPNELLTKNGRAISLAKVIENNIKDIEKEFKQDVKDTECTINK